MSIIDVLFPQTAPEPKGVTYRRNWMRSTDAPKQRTGLTKAEILRRDRVRKMQKKLEGKNAD